MNADELKEVIISKISEIDDPDILNAMNDILGAGLLNLKIELTVKEIKEIASSRKDVREGVVLDHNILKKEVQAWLRAR